MTGMSRFEYGIVAAIVLVVVGTGVVSYAAIRSGNSPAPQFVGCTAEAKMCPDGTAVGREGPNCEFAACPLATSTSSVATTTNTGGGGGIAPFQSGIRGTVLLGPTCPVMRDPPDPQCADKPYATSISASRKGSSSVFATTKSDAQGKFQFSLPPGEYTVSAQGGETLPRCSSVDAMVAAKGYATISISCDTGIR